MITVDVDMRTHTIEAKGHANSAPKGEDLVCAGASALLGALAATLEDNPDLFRRTPNIKVVDGLGKVSCKPKKEYLHKVSLIYLPIVYGFELMSDVYPDYITLNVRG